MFYDYFDIDIERLRREVTVSEDGILDGRAIAKGVESQVADGVKALRGRGVVPHLAVVRVGADAASEIYVNQKIKSCDRLGMESSHVHLPGDLGREELIRRIRSLVNDETVHGVLLQLPLPDHLEEHAFIERITPSNDVDGFHPRNLGCLMAGKSELEPCTPRGIMTMLRAAEVDPAGKEAVVIGRSRMVGRPMAQMLMRADATVTVCHRHTGDLAAHVSRADIVVVATGVPHLVEGDWVADGAVVIDVGISRTEEGNLVGDVEFDAARPAAELITPVPGGVGPMTVATLMRNAVVATCWQSGFRFENGEIKEITDEQ